MELLWFRWERLLPARFVSGWKLCTQHSSTVTMLVERLLQLQNVLKWVSQTYGVLSDGGWVVLVPTWRRIFGTAVLREWYGAPSHDWYSILHFIDCYPPAFSVSFVPVHCRVGQEPGSHKPILGTTLKQKLNQFWVEPLIGGSVGGLTSDGGVSCLKIVASKQ